MAKANTFRGLEIGEWFEMWLDDKKSILNTMIKNLQSDLDNGYDYFGMSATKQREDIDAYKKVTDDTLEMFKTMEEKDIDKWCYFDMVKRGAIEV